MLRITKRVVIIAEILIKNNSQKQRVETIYTKVPNCFPRKRGLLLGHLLFSVEM
jgi:hypothetical protein